MAFPVASRLWRLLITPYRPKPELRDFLANAQHQESPRAEVTVAVLDARQSTRCFGVSLARRGIQPVYLKIVNRSNATQRLQLLKIDPNYYTPLEAAGVCHFSIAKRLSAFGLIGWLYFFPLLLLVPLKLVTAWLANRRMDRVFESRAFRLRPIEPGTSSEGFVFTPLDVGAKVVHVCLHAIEEPFDSAALATGAAPTPGQPAAPLEFTFTISVPGIATDHARRDFATLAPAGSLVDCDLATLVRNLTAMPAATSNARATRWGDPANLIVIGDFDTLLAAFVARWDESESITLATCWKTVRAFLLGSQYRYSPVSPLYMFGRSQDVALQRTRGSINERLHLRLWLTGLRFEGRAVWVGQVSRDIGVRFTTKAWNLTTHRIDPEVDEAREYVVEDLLQAERIVAAGYVDGVGHCDNSSPRANLTGDPYFTDGKRAVILLSEARTRPRFIAWS